MLAHRRSLPRNLLGSSTIPAPVPIYIPGWRKALWALSLLPKNTTASFLGQRFGLGPGPCYPGTSAVIMRPQFLNMGNNLLCFDNKLTNFALFYFRSVGVIAYILWVKYLMYVFCHKHPRSYRVCTRDVIKSKEPLKVLTSSGIKSTKFILVYNFPSQLHPLFGNYRLLNFEVMEVRDITRRSHLSKNRQLSQDF